jgi:hypothetical protein
MRLLAAGLVALLSLAPVAPVAVASGAPIVEVQALPSTWILVVAGVGGDAEHRQRFASLATAMSTAASERHGIARERVVCLVERTELAPEVASARSTRDEIETAVARIGSEAAPGDRVLLLLIGHGSTRGSQSFFNLPGPDMSAADFAAMLDLLADQEVAVVNTSSASGGFVGALAAPGRTVVTATRSGREQQEPVFVEHFVAAYSGDGADTDKDGRISILEAFVYANAEVARAYEIDGLIRTEHALLDDDGDGEGSATPGGEGSDGQRARRFAIGAAVAGLDATPAEELDAATRELLLRRAELESELEALRAARESMTEDEYDDRLEEILLEIAEIDAMVRAQGGQQ